MANTPNSRKVALETAKDRREQLVDEQALKEIELSNAQTARERKQIQKELNALIKEEASIRARIASYEDKSVAAEKSIADNTDVASTKENLTKYQEANAQIEEMLKQNDSDRNLITDNLNKTMRQRWNANFRSSRSNSSKNSNLLLGFSRN
jgi:hypothetical protein